MSRDEQEAWPKRFDSGSHAYASMDGVVHNITLVETDTFSVREQTDQATG